MTKHAILAFIKSKIYAVICTCDPSGQPESALIGFGQTDNFELIFGTNTSTRKYKNIENNNRVAMVIGWDADLITVQLEGKAIELNTLEREKYLDSYFRKVPQAKKFESVPGQSYFKIIPTWIRYSDLSTSIPKIIEFDF